MEKAHALLNKVEEIKAKDELRMTSQEYKELVELIQGIAMEEEGKKYEMIYFYKHAEACFDEEPTINFSLRKLGPIIINYKPKYETMKHLIVRCERLGLLEVSKRTMVDFAFEVFGDAHDHYGTIHNSYCGTYMNYSFVDEDNSSESSHSYKIGQVLTSCEYNYLQIREV